MAHHNICLHEAWQPYTVSKIIFACIKCNKAESDNGCTFIKAICPVCAICYLCDISAKDRTYIN